ncbi:hypothetical protein P3L10_022935 [Capsicum annuum]
MERVIYPVALLFFLLCFCPRTFAREEVQQMAVSPVVQLSPLYGSLCKKTVGYQVNKKLATAFFFVCEKLDGAVSPEY